MAFATKGVDNCFLEHPFSALDVNHETHDIGTHYYKTIIDLWLQANPGYFIRGGCSSSLTLVYGGGLCGILGHFNTKSHTSKVLRLMLSK